MADSQEKSDDLIAELAKLMASNAQGGESEPKPTVIKLTPLSDATVPPPAPLRIPGMETSSASAGSAASTPTVRIPGLEKPAEVDHPSRAEAPPESKPQAAHPEVPPQPASAARAAPPTPNGSWQRPAEGADVHRPAPPATVPPAAKPQPHAPTARIEPTIAPVAAPADAAQREVSSTGGNGFRFDFGLAAGDGEAGGRGEDSPGPERPDVAVPALDNDPIADLIAAELDAAQAVTTPEPAKAETVPAAAAFPSSVEAIAARSLGNTTAGQAPVLVARPAATAHRATVPAPMAFKPLQQAAKPAEGDKFAVAPVFGLGGKSSPTIQPPAAAPTSVVPARPAQAGPEFRTPPAAEHPQHEPDPMDEIESLIGEAVRVELAGGDGSAAADTETEPQPQAPAAPVVPPLTTGFAPRRAGLKDNEPQLRSAEAAILAAAAATGVEVGRVEPAAQEEGPYRRKKVRQPNAGMLGGARQYVGMAVAGTLLLAAGFGLYWVLGMGRGDTEVPVLSADTTPAKQAPAPAAPDTAEPPRSVVFNEIDGVPAVDSAETLVSRDETAGASVAEVARVVTPESDTTESGLANRKVRTVTVRPDGTIVSGDEAIAGSEALPVDRPNVPVVPGATVEPSDLLTAAVAETAPTAEEADPIAAVIAEGETEGAPPLEMAALAPTNETPAVFDGSLVAPVPMPRPADRTALVGGGAPAATGLDNLPLVDLNEPAPVAATPAGTAPAYVQLSSQRSEAEAQASLRAAQARWGDVFAGNQLEIQRADLGQKGIYYRVRLPASSLQDATQICASIKANGGDCFATGG